MAAPARNYTLDPVTFEVLKNAFVTTVDQMAEQILRTCHSFVLYARDFSSALCDPSGDTIMQGSQDIAVHVGTLHFTAKATIDAFAGRMRPGDVYAINDPYAGGTHFCDVRVVRPIFHEGELIAYAQSNGHWADVGGSVPGSFDVNAREHFGEGLRITPVRMYHEGRYCDDVVRMIVSNTRSPEGNEGDLHSQVEATAVAERELVRLIGRYGLDTVVTAFQEVQDYVERLTRQRVSRLPDGTWETEDYLDYDPTLGEGLIPVRVRMTIEGDQIHYDLSGSHPAVGTFLNGSYGSTFSGVVTGRRCSDLPLNSGFYRALTVDLGPVGTVVNAGWPTAVTGFCSGAYGKVVNSVMELWSTSDARASDRVLSRHRVPPDRRSRRALRGIGRSSCGTTGWSTAGVAAMARTARTRPSTSLRCRRGGAAVRGAGTPHPGDHERALDAFAELGWTRAVSRRLRRAEGRHPDRCEGDGHVVLLRPRTVDHMGHPGRPAVDPAGRLAAARRRGDPLPGGDLLERSSRGRRLLHACLGRWRRIRRPARARPGARPRRCRGGLCHPATRTARLRRRAAWTRRRTSACTRSTRRAPPASEPLSARLEPAGSRRTRRTSLPAIDPAS